MTPTQQQAVQTLQHLAREVIDIQNACNPLGLSKRYAEVLQALANAGLPELGGTHGLSVNPIHQLWAAKMIELTHMGTADQEQYSKAYWFCNAIASGGASVCDFCTRLVYWLPAGRLGTKNGYYVNLLGEAECNFAHRPAHSVQGVAGTPPVTESVSTGNQESVNANCPS